MKNKKTFKVTFTRKLGGERTMLVRAKNEADAIKNAEFLCFTGKDFRGAQETDEEYTKPLKQGLFNHLKTI